jgi:NAD(P) transhydrogenase subunit alpha
MMMTPGGTVPPAQLLIMGVGVAGLQAIATARRLGAIVTATDVRPATKEQVQPRRQVRRRRGRGVQGRPRPRAAMPSRCPGVPGQAGGAGRRDIKKQDIVITTALIPGRKAPVLVTEEMVRTMKPGSVIVDIAVEQGGNCPLAEFGKVVEKYGVKIVGPANLPGRWRRRRLGIYARNLLNFMTPLVDKETKALKINLGGRDREGRRWSPATARCIPR